MKIQPIPITSLWSGFNMKIDPRLDKSNKIICASSEDSDQPGHPPSPIRVSAVHLKQNWVLSYPLSAQRRLWSDWADAQADLSLRWAQKSFCWVCHEVAQNASSRVYAAHIHFITFFFYILHRTQYEILSHANNIVLWRDNFIHSLNWC